MVSDGMEQRSRPEVDFEVTNGAEHESDRRAAVGRPVLGMDQTEPRVDLCDQAGAPSRSRTFSSRRRVNMSSALHLHGQCQQGLSIRTGRGRSWRLLR